MSRICRIVTVFPLLVLALVAAPRAAQDLADKHVFVTVLDKEGLPIEGLTTEHFAIMESGRERPVVKVEPLQVPMHIAVLVDTSAITGPDEPFRAAIVEFVDRLAAFNTVAVYSTGDRATLVVPFTKDQAQLRAGTIALISSPFLTAPIIAW